MATIAEFSVAADEFPLGHLFESLPAVSIEIEQVVPTNHTILPYFWVRNVAVDRVLETLKAQGTLDSYAVVDDLGTQGLFRAEWDPNAEGVLTGIVDAELTLLSATGTQDEWLFQFRAEDTDRIASFQRYCKTHGIAIELTRFHSVGATDSTGQYDLTSEQREALLLALDKGYYGIPREADLELLADEFGITRQSVADRLRRGHRNLVRATLSHE